MSATTQTTTEAEEQDGVLDTLEAKFDAFEERIGLKQYTDRTTVAKGVAYYTMATAATGSAAAQAGAQPSQGGGGSGGSDPIGATICDSDLGSLVSNVLNLLVAVGFLGGLYAVTRASLKYMNAGGDPEKKSDARESLVMSGFGLGLVIVLMLLPSFFETLIPSSAGSSSIDTCLKPFA